MNDSTEQPPSLLPLLAVNFIGTLGFGLVLPFLVFLVTRWGGNALVYGLMSATYSAFQLVGAPILGRWSDRYGRRRILLLSQLGTTLSWVIFLVAFLLPQQPILAVESRVLGSVVLTLPLVTLFVARALDGLTGGNVSVANAYLADVTSEEQRSTNFGRMAISANLGFILGPALAGLLGTTAAGELIPVLAAFLISLVATLIVAFRLPESKPCVLARNPESPNVRKVFGHEQKECFQMHGSPRLSLREILGLRGVPVMLAIYFLVMLGFHLFYVTFPVYAVTILQWSVFDTGVFFSVLGVLMILVQGPVLRRAAEKISEGTLILGGSLLLAVSFALFDTHEIWRVYAGVALMALGNGVMWPSVLSVLSKAAGEEHQGSVQGFAGSVGAVASIVGLAFGGVLYGVLKGQMFWVSGATILAAAVIAMASLTMLRRLGASISA